jgi:hypothetical protein
MLNKNNLLPSERSLYFLFLVVNSHLKFVSLGEVSVFPYFGS